MQATLEQESIDRCTHTLISGLVEETLGEEVQEVGEEVFEVDVVEKLRLLEESRRATQLMVAGRFFRRWRNRYAGRLADDILT